MALRYTPSAVVAAVALLLAFGEPAVARPAAVNGPWRLTAASPFAAGCADQVEQKGFGSGIADAETEPSLTADPRDPDHLVAAWMQDLYGGYVAAWSSNGGARWHTSLVPGNSTCTGDGYELAADPWLSTGGDGTTYLAGLSLDLNDTPNASGPPYLPFRSRLQVNRSTDGGRTWSAPAVVVAGEGRLHDKPSITADPRRDGHAYLVWTEFLTPLGPPAEGISFSRTSDGGATWSAPRHLDLPAPPGATPQGALVLVLDDGSLLVVTTVRARNGTADPHRIYATRSADLGESWSAPVLVAEFPATDRRHSTPWSDPETGEAIDAPEWAVSAAAAPDGEVHVVWRHRTGPDSAEVRMADSTDRGGTWNAAHLVAGPGGQTFLPVVAVGPDGTLGVTYYDDRNDVPGDAAYPADLWFAHSHDGGATWQERHLAGPVDLRTALLRKIPVRGLFLGDYHGLVAARGGFGSVAALARPEAAAGGSDLFFTRIHTSPRR
ncbi:MAG: sialidase family protein [Mycobacteriales bacterium]